MSRYKDDLIKLMCDKSDELTKEDELKCINAIRNNKDEAAFNQLLCSLSCKIAGRIWEKYLKYESSEEQELAAYNRFSYAYAYAPTPEGALDKAIQSFDESKKMSFAGYFLEYYLPDLILKADGEFGYALSIPDSVMKRNREYSRTVNDLTLELFREPTLEEIAERMGCSRAIIQEMLSATNSDNLCQTQYGNGVLKDENDMESYEPDDGNNQEESNESNAEEGSEDETNESNEENEVPDLEESDEEQIAIAIEPDEDDSVEEIFVEDILRPLEYKVFRMVEGQDEYEGRRMSFLEIADTLKLKYRNITFDWVKAFYESALLKIEHYARVKKQHRLEEELD